MDDLATITVSFQVPQLEPLIQRIVEALHALRVSQETGSIQVAIALDHLGEVMADSLEPIREELAGFREDLVTTLDTEITQIADALQGAHQDPAAVLEIVGQLRDLRTNLVQKIQGIIPEAPPPDTAPLSGV